ncbi:MAG: ACP synthase, partial [Nitrospinae bacterium]|nr:ACP synthase [Nitrospinota bacterium]
EARLHGVVKELADNQNIKDIMVSISHDTDYAIAYVTVID